MRSMTMTEIRLTCVHLRRRSYSWLRRWDFPLALCCRHSIRVYLNRVGTMRANAIRFLIGITSVFIAHVNQASLAIGVKRISTIAKALSVRKIILNVSMESILFIVNVNQISNEVGTRLDRQQQTETIFILFSRLGRILCGTEPLRLVSMPSECHVFQLEWWSVPLHVSTDLYG